MYLKNSSLLMPFSILVCCILLLLLSQSVTHAALSPLVHTTSAKTDINPNPISEQSGSSMPETVDSEEMTGSVKAPLFSKNTLAELQLFLEDFSLRAYWRVSILDINKGRLFHDITIALNSLATLSGFSSILVMFVFIGVVFLLAAILEWLFRIIVLRRYLGKPKIRKLTLPHRLKLALKQAVPELISLVFFSAASYFSYIIVYSTFFSIICPFYLSTLVTITVIRFFAIVSALFLAPFNETIRLISWDDKTSRIVYRSAILFISVLTIAVMTTSLLKYGGLKGDSLLLVELFFGTTLLVLTGIVVFLNRKTIASWVLGNFSPDRISRESGQIVSYTWLSMLISYLFLIWLFWSGKLILSESRFTLAFSASLLIIPIFLILDSLTGWLFGFVGKALSGNVENISTEKDTSEYDQEPGVLYSNLRILSRLILIGFLLLWMLHLWGIRFPYTAVIISSMRKVTFLFIIFFFLWRVIDQSIGHLLAQKEESSLGEDDGGESEWGDGQLLDRSQTLLPIVRKFLGIIMLVMLVLFTLSSLGVNIGPLLAGAGVMGIAIGFGAQKLVSDLLSGFFYLVDDAFRVGEYIEGGSITGTVERITLRNLMLRHHRGMLQIIPYSDLGAITNYMRGGVVVKFNLQLPYDTDIDKVRKVIKRVGKEMIEDPEFTNNFIKPLKSQGIREVGDSVLTVRAKFTAKPGTHFVIRREAYRRITEALNANNIYYAHRKVIVDFPESIDPETIDQNTREQLLKAGAAATLATNASDQGNPEENMK